MPKHAGGRPLIFPNVEELQAKINAYFLDCDEKSLPDTITGLALLKTSRETLLNYEDRAEYFDTIKEASMARSDRWNDEKRRNVSRDEGFRVSNVVRNLVSMLKRPRNAALMIRLPAS